MAEGIYKTETYNLVAGQSLELTGLGKENQDIHIIIKGDQSAPVFLHHGEQDPLKGFEFPDGETFVAGPLRLGSRYFPKFVFCESSTSVTIQFLLE